MKVSYAVTGFANSFDQLLKSRAETDLADAQQGAAGNIAHAGGLNDERRRSTFGKSPIPVEIVLRDKSVFGRAPRNHRRNPRAALKRQATQSRSVERVATVRLLRPWASAFQEWDA